MEAPYHTPAGTPMFSELAGYESQIRRIISQVRSLTDGLTDEQFNWRPAPHRWSIAENMDHLTLIGNEHLPALDDAIAAGQSHSLYGEGPFFRYGLIDRLIVWSMEPPVRFPLRAARRVLPRPDRPLAVVLPAFLALQEELLARVRRANGLDLSQVKVRSPLIQSLAISLGKAFGALLAHQRRHLWQAASVRRARDFPG